MPYEAVVSCILRNCPDWRTYLSHAIARCHLKQNDPIQNVVKTQFRDRHGRRKSANLPWLCSNMSWLRLKSHSHGSVFFHISGRISGSSRWGKVIAVHCILWFPMQVTCCCEGAVPTNMLYKLLSPCCLMIAWLYLLQARGDKLKKIQKKQCIRKLHPNQKLRKQITRIQKLPSPEFRP